MPTTVDQVTRRRLMRLGLTAHDPERAAPGYVVYSPMRSPGDVIALDGDGEAVHRWKLPYAPGLHGYLLPNGNLFYNGQVEDEQTAGRFPSWDNFKGGAMLEVDWDGTLVWEHRDPDHHHDGRRTSSGGAIYLTVERMSDHDAARVRGGVPGTDAEGMWVDVIVEVDARGSRVWEWHAQEHLDPEEDVITAHDHRSEWTHGNTVVPLGAEHVLASFRNISTVVIIEKASGEITWKLGPEVLAQQHDPSVLPNGNLLIFDNGMYRPDKAMPQSRVIELDRTSGEIVWQYEDRPVDAFFSPYISGARRLYNGNTLVTEGFSGRIFQVTAAGEVVWEYVNPHFHLTPRGDYANRVFRANHYAPGEIPGFD